MADISVVEVRIWGRSAGALAPLRGRPGFYEFQYSPDFAGSGLELSPLHMPLKARQRYSFPALAQETFHGLPGLLADSLPDKFGNALIDEYLARHGTRTDAITTLQRLVYVGRRAMGALEFEPAAAETRSPAAAGASSYGASGRRRPPRAARRRRHDCPRNPRCRKLRRRRTRQGRHRLESPDERGRLGQFDLPAGFEHWLLKFDVGADGELNNSAGFGRIEYAHYLMAVEAGITMSECRLLEESGRAHFMTKRFDRRGNAKVHIHSLCGLAHLDFNTPYVHGYEQYLRAVLDLKLDASALEQAWLRCAFNIAAVNCDDHTKNFAFLLDRTGTWDMAPAYDTCFSHNPPAAGKWTRQHQMLVGGKAWDITAEDLLALADTFDIRKPGELLRRIAAAVAAWPAFAGRAGVPRAEIARIQAFQPEWVRRSAPEPLLSPRRAATPARWDG